MIVIGVMVVDDVAEYGAYVEYVLLDGGVREGRVGLKEYDLDAFAYVLYALLVVHLHVHVIALQTCLQKVQVDLQTYVESHASARQQVIK